jgi:two-component system OmpR family sensor kinase
VDLTLLCLESLSDAGAAGQQHRWNLVLPDEPIEVPGDPLRLHQVLANLLANARTHTPPGTRVEVELSTAGSYALLQVRDQGPGIPAALRPDIFGRFVRGDSSRSRAAGSSGLGLAIVAAVVEAHHGSVDVVSGPQGTEFSVRLPMDGVAVPDLSGLAEPATAR